MRKKIDNIKLKLGLKKFFIMSNLISLQKAAQIINYRYKFSHIGIICRIKLIKEEYIKILDEHLRNTLGCLEELKEQNGAGN